MPKMERPAPTGIGDGADLVITRKADHIQPANRDQATSRISRRFFLTMATAATVAELAQIGGAP